MLPNNTGLEIGSAKKSQTPVEIVFRIDIEVNTRKEADAVLKVLPELNEYIGDNHFRLCLLCPYCNG